MKVFVSTKETQGKRKNDFSFTNEGELLKFGFECDGETIDGRCGCRRSMVGFETWKATTTFKITDSKLTENELLNLLMKSDKEAGWDLRKETQKKHIKELIRLADSFDIDCVLERRGDSIKQRIK